MRKAFHIVLQVWRKFLLFANSQSSCWYETSRNYQFTSIVKSNSQYHIAKMYVFWPVRLHVLPTVHSIIASFYAHDLLVDKIMRIRFPSFPPVSEWRFINKWEFYNLMPGHVSVVSPSERAFLLWGWVMRMRSSSLKLVFVKGFHIGCFDFTKMHNGWILNVFHHK